MHAGPNQLSCAPSFPRANHCVLACQGHRMGCCNGRKRETDQFRRRFSTPGPRTDSHRGSTQALATLRAPGPGRIPHTGLQPVSRRSRIRSVHNGAVRKTQVISQRRSITATTARTLDAAPGSAESGSASASPERSRGREGGRGEVFNPHPVYGGGPGSAARRADALPDPADPGAASGVRAVTERRGEVTCVLRSAPLCTVRIRLLRETDGAGPLLAPAPARIDPARRRAGRRHATPVVGRPPAFVALRVGSARAGEAAAPRDRLGRTRTDPD
jgi:hypothetical protein